MNTATSSLRNLLTFLSPKFVALLAVVGILATSFVLIANARPSAAPNPNPTWNVDARILFRAQAEPFDHFAVKDPTIVFSGGRWHMFYTGANASGGWQMLYSSATTLEGFRTAPHTFVRLTAGSTVTFVNLASVGINSSGWTLLTGTVPVSWSGTLTGVLFYVETAAGTDNIYIDDASLHR